MNGRPKRLKSLILLPVLFVLVCGDAAQASRGLAQAPSRPDAEKILKARAQADDGKVDDAQELLTKMIAEEKDRERRALLRLSLAMILFRAARDAAAEEQFRLALEDGSRVPDYVHFHLGLLKKKLDRPKEARADFEKVLGLKSTPRATETDARFQLAHVFTAEKNWRQATQQLEQLKKRLRGDERYPEVIHQLMLVNKKSGRRPAFCQAAKELFAKYPTHASVQSWGPRLDQNIVEGEKTGCSASNKDLKMRVRRLWLGGEEPRAEAELKFLKDEEDDDGYSVVDNLMVNHLIGDGRIDEALKMLLARYDQSRSRVPYLLLLAKAAQAAGEYQMAVSSYQRAYDLAPRGKQGVSSLFQAAFTSYQMQDYDGASRRFERVVKAHGGSRFARDSQWHLAWIRYLRGDYVGAAESFAALRKPTRKVSRRRRGQSVSPDLVAADRIQYWTAMSHLKMGKAQESIPLFQKLASDPSLGYYAMLAYYRLLSIPGAKLPVEVESRLGIKRGEPPAQAANEEELKAAAAAAAEAAKAEFAEDIGLAQKDTGEDDDEDDDDVSEESAVAETPSIQVPPNFKDPQLVQKFERARDLALVGLDDAARRELREIEKRARSAADRKLLMTEYAAVKSYERSSFIGEVGFGAARLRTGLKGESRLYWEFAYPRAWDNAVQQASRSTSVPEELIWGIMRAESHFRFDAQSPVGALGLMQVMPFTARKVADLMNLKSFDTRSLLVPETNIRLGSRYLQRLVEKFSGKVPLVAAGYNAGPHRVNAWVRNFGTLDMDEFIEHIPYVETRNYVKRVVRNCQIYGLLYQGSSQAMSWLIQPVGVRVKDATAVHEIW